MSENNEAVIHTERWRKHKFERENNTKQKGILANNKNLIYLTIKNVQINSMNNLIFHVSYQNSVTCHLQDPYWFMARNKRGEQGLIPASYVEKRFAILNLDIGLLLDHRLKNGTY